MDLDYRELLVKIARKIQQDELDTMKFLCGKQLTKTRVGAGEAPVVYQEVLSFFGELEKEEKLKCDNLELLKRLLVNAERQDLASMLENFQTGFQSHRMTSYSSQITAHQSSDGCYGSCTDSQEKETALDKESHAKSTKDKESQIESIKGNKKKAKKKKYKEKKKKQKLAEKAILEQVEDKVESIVQEEEKEQQHQQRREHEEILYTEHETLDFPSPRLFAENAKLPTRKKSETAIKEVIPAERKKDFSYHDQTLKNVADEVHEQELTTSDRIIQESVTKERLVDQAFPQDVINKKKMTESLDVLSPGVGQKNDFQNDKTEKHVTETSKNSMSKMSPPLPSLCVLLVCNKWQSWGESIPVINRELCLALARAGHQVACLVLTSTDVEREEAQNENVELITCMQKPGIKNDDPQLLQFHDLNTFVPDLVIGHGKATGPAALFYADKLSRPRMHVIHDLPDECLKYDEVIDKNIKEEDLAISADFVAVVGTLLYEKWSGILNLDVIEIIPGLPSLDTRNRISSPQSRYFVPAKFSSPLSSGLDLAVMAVNNSSGRDTLPRKATLIPRSTDSKEPGKSTKKILKNCDRDRVELNLNVRQEIKSQQALIDLQGATSFLSPARSEAFGVSTLDAIAIGIPIVVSSRSGIACTIRKYFDQKFHSSIIDVSSECSGSADDDDGDEDAMVFANQLDRASLCQEKVFTQAEELRSEWSSKFTWDKVVKHLHNSIINSGKISPELSRKLPISLSGKRLPDYIVSLVKELKLFDKRKKFVLFLSPTEACPPEAAYLGLIQWAAVFDFDRDSVDVGYLKTCQDFLENSGRPACRMLPPPEEDSGKQKQSVTLPGGGIPWILLQGLPDMARDTHENLDWIQEVLQQIKKSYHCPITFLILWETAKKNKSLCKKLSKLLTVAEASPLWKNVTPIELLSLSDEVDSRLEDIAEEWDVEIKKVDHSDFCKAVQSTALVNPFYEPNADFSLPKINHDGDIVVEALPTSSRWVDLVVEPLYTSIGDTPEFGTEDAYHFYRGGKISWYGIEMDYAIEKESWFDPLIKNAIENEMEYPGAASMTLFHQRGTGGTTTARKLLYDFHRRYPCVCLKNINYETYLAIKVIWEFCSLKILILADLKDAVNDIEVLYGNLSSDRISCLILHVVHRQNYTKQMQKKSLVLAQTLTQEERGRFCNVYSSQNQSKKEELNEFKSNAEDELQIPFYYGLVAFGKEFKGLEPFVMECLEGLDDKQQQAMCFLSIAYHYAKMPTPTSSLAGIFNLKPYQPDSIYDFLTTNSIELLIEDEPECWRPRHYTIGKEIIHQLLSTPYNINKKNWKMYLADKIVEFISYMEEDLTAAILLNRIHDETTFKQFSSLVGDIPDEDVIRVFNKAIEIYPENPFFRVHLGRYYSVKMDLDGFIDACKHTDDGILLAVDFSKNVRSQLTQMKGMVYKRQVSSKIHKNAPLEEIIPLAVEGVKAFTRAVSISIEHLEGASIPQVRMMCDIFKYINRTVEGGVFGYLHLPSPNPFIQNGISETSDVLESVSDSIYYPSLRKNLFNFGVGKKVEKKEDLIEHFKKLKETFKTSTASINRQIVLIELDLCKEKNRPVSQIAKKLIQLLEEALKHDQNINLTMRLWVKVAPHIPVTLMSAESKILTWSNKGKSVMSYLYRYIFTCIRILEGGRDQQFEDNRLLAWDDLNKAVSAAKRHGIKHPDRPVVFLGDDRDKGMGQLVIPEESVKDVRRHRTVPEEYSNKLRRLTGIITMLKGTVGNIKAHGLNISFRTDLCQPQIVGASFEAKKVKFCLAFTYFGQDAYNVKIIAD